MDQKRDHPHLFLKTNILKILANFRTNAFGSSF